MNKTTTKQSSFNKIGVLFSVTILIVLLFSCTAERELAREFVNTKKGTPILLLSTDRLILTNEKLKRILNFDSLDVSSQDSLWAAKTLYLDSISDVKLLNKFYEKIKDELQCYGFRVFTRDSISSFNSLEVSKYILNIAQVEMNEDDYIYRDEQLFFNSLVYYQDQTLNVINLNYWFEFSSSGLNNEKVFYSTFSMKDILESSFLLDDANNNVTYHYKITPITLAGIYQLTDYSAIKNTNYFYNYLMNKYVKENLPSNVVTPKYFSYDRYTGFLFNVENDRFLELDSK
ncbi:MAG: hypothetical protein HXX18_12865 [Bacteroidetes bacterium]|nr:hypothetical protein [Bacteroidota bacterium]